MALHPHERFLLHFLVTIFQSVDHFLLFLSAFFGQLYRFFLTHYISRLKFCFFIDTFALFQNSQKIRKVVYMSIYWYNSNCLHTFLAIIYKSRPSPLSFETCILYILTISTFLSSFISWPRPPSWIYIIMFLRYNISKHFLNKWYNNPFFGKQLIIWK